MLNVQFSYSKEIFQNKWINSMLHTQHFNYSGTGRTKISNICLSITLSLLHPNFHSVERKKKTNWMQSLFSLGFLLLCVVFVWWRVTCTHFKRGKSWKKVIMQISLEIFSGEQFLSSNLKTQYKVLNFKFYSISVRKRFVYAFSYSFSPNLRHSIFFFWN